MVVANDLRDFGVILDVSEDSFSDRRVLLHHAALFERECTGLFEQASGKSDLPDVVNQPAEMSHLTFGLAQPEPLNDVARIDRHRSRVTSRVPVSRVKRRYEGSREREVRPFQTPIDYSEIFHEASLVLVEGKELVKCERRHQEQRQCQRRHVLIRDGEQRDERHVKRY